MTSRERVLAALGHQTPDHVPVCLAYETPHGLAARYGVPCDEELMRQDVYRVGLDLGPPPPELPLRSQTRVPATATIDSWGVARWPSSTGDTHAVLGPLVSMTDPAELADYPFPKVPESVPSPLADEVAILHEGNYAVEGAMSQTIFELAWNMYGMERLMIAFSENAAFVFRLLDEITVRKQQMARLFVTAGVDILRLGDDVGSQRGMLMSPQTWRRFLKPRLASVIAAAREVQSDIEIFYHSDGDVREIIGELIEIGVTILNPIQPECMDPFEIKRTYGDRLTLWGTIGTQSTLPRGPREEIRQRVQEYIERLGKHGGYVIGPTHTVNRDVPWDHVLAFYEAVRDYG